MSSLLGVLKMACLLLLLHVQPGWGKFAKTGSGTGSRITVNGVTAGPFDPSKVSNWQYDSRFPMIPSKGGGTCNQNIYNANAVKSGGAWNVYFGGWDGVSCHDEISVTVTLDRFQSFNPHAKQIEHGSVKHVNNPSAIKVNDTLWAMVYTQGSAGMNKPGISTSQNGVTWSPRSGGLTSALVTMEGFSAFSDADINGGNVIYYDKARDALHLYFVDFKQLRNHSVFHAISSGISTHFTYTGVALAEPQRVVNDLAYINSWYVMTMHSNGPHTFYSASKSLDSFPASKLLFTPRKQVRPLSQPGVRRLASATGAFCRLRRHNLGIGRCEPRTRPRFCAHEHQQSEPYRQVLHVRYGLRGRQEPWNVA